MSAIFDDDEGVLAGLKKGEHPLNCGTAADQVAPGHDRIATPKAPYRGVRRVVSDRLRLPRSEILLHVGLNLLSFAVQAVYGGQTVKAAFFIAQGAVVALS